MSIDGVEISNIPRHQLRQAMTTITQDAIELDVSVRINLWPQALVSEDADDKKNDDKMKAALQTVGLWEHVRERGGVGELMGDMDFSAGQKQLFSLARAILHHSMTGSKVVLVDEATSNVDRESDQRVQQVMREQFDGCTKLVIAHRLKTIADADLIIKLDDGRIKCVGDYKSLKDMGELDDKIEEEKEKEKAEAEAEAEKTNKGEEKVDEWEVKTEKSEVKTEKSEEKTEKSEGKTEGKDEQ